MNENQNYTIAEDFVLPSDGQIYDHAFDPHVKLRSMTVREEMKRLSQSSSVHRNLCEIIDACLLTKLPYSCYDLCVGDYEYLLHKLRVVTYGPNYKMVVGCPHCSSIHEEEISLDDLRTKEFDVNEFQDSLRFELPKSQATIKLKFQTPRLLDKIDQQVKEFKKHNPTITFDPTILITLQNMIDEVNDVKMSYSDLETFINSLNAKDGNFILNKISKISGMIGLDTEVDVVCKQCGGDIKTFFRFGPEFFRPTED